MGFTLDLSDADTSGFQPLPAGKYLAEIYEVEEEETSGDGKLPEGVKMLNLKWNITEAADADIEIEGRRAFMRLVLVEDDLEYPDDKKRKLKGMVVNTLLGLGYSQEELMTPGFELEPDDLVERSACITLNRKEYPKSSGNYNNNIQGVNPVDTFVGGGSGVL